MLLCMFCLVLGGDVGILNAWPQEIAGVRNYRPLPAYPASDLCTRQRHAYERSPLAGARPGAGRSS